MAFNVNSIDDEKVIGGVGGEGVEVIDVFHKELKNNSNQVVLRCKVGSILASTYKEENCDTDYENISEDVVDVSVWVPNDKKDTYQKDLKRLNQTLSHLSGTHVDEGDADAWHEAVTEDGEIRRLILDNSERKAYLKVRAGSNGSTFKNLDLRFDVQTPQKLTMAQFKAKQSKKTAEASVF